MSRQYMVVEARIVTTTAGFETVYSGGLRFNVRDDAIREGLREVGSDDFNIAVVDDDRLISFDWMDDPTGEREEDLREIADQLDLKYIGEP